MIKRRLTRDGRGGKGGAAYETDDPKHGDCEIDTVGLRGGPARKLPKARTYEGREDLTGMIGNVVLVHRFFHTKKNFRNLGTNPKKCSPTLS